MTLELDFVLLDIVVCRSTPFKLWRSGVVIWSRDAGFTKTPIVRRDGHCYFGGRDRWGCCRRQWPQWFQFLQTVLKKRQPIGRGHVFLLSSSRLRVKAILPDQFRTSFLPWRELPYRGTMMRIGRMDFLCHILFCAADKIHAIFFFRSVSPPVVWAAEVAAWGPITENRG